MIGGNAHLRGFADMTKERKALIAELISSAA